jgi:hypothetical protein
LARTPSALTDGNRIEPMKMRRFNEISGTLEQWRDRNLWSLGLQGMRMLLLVTACCMAGAVMPTSLLAGNLYLPNSSFESPPVPPVSPYAGPELDFWHKSPQPAWYDPSQNFDTPWDYLMGAFYNVPFPGQFIENCDGDQAAFLFALPEVALFQDFSPRYGTNPAAGYGLAAKFNVGRSYHLTASVLGGGGGMKPGVSLELRFYYRDASSNRIQVATTSITNSSEAFPTNTHFVTFQLHVPAVKETDPWAGKDLGVEIASTVRPDLAGGYWDVDQVRVVESIDVPNGSFETPIVPPVSPYADSNMDFWQKSPQPGWYDPSQNADTPWEYLMGTFYNVPFPGQFIDNCDGAQAAFLFALPEAGLFQDYNSLSGTNSTPSHALNATFAVGKAYSLTVAVLGGSGGMKPGATFQIGLYYRDALSNRVMVASTTITNSSAAFPTNTHFVDYQVQIPGVRANDPWAGENIGIQLLSTVGFDLTGGYWDVDNIRLSETTAPKLTSLRFQNGLPTFTLLSEPGVEFEIQSTTNLPALPDAWSSVGTFTNLTGAGSFTETMTHSQPRFYRAYKR